MTMMLLILIDLGYASWDSIIKQVVNNTHEIQVLAKKIEELHLGEL
jgi:hypothetical protein